MSNLMVDIASRLMHKIASDLAARTNGCGQHATDRIKGAPPSRWSIAGTFLWRTRVPDIE
jgi:hypothetical protein